ncbi:MAG: serine/threonine-protein kinase [Isosphaeraceae bacterium]|nr:serine/threonine-protein kinase [Isosphaeraceae bacterium]
MGPATDRAHSASGPLCAKEAVGAERVARIDSYLTGAGLDPALADLAEEITERLQAGETFDPDDYEVQHPQWAGQIRRLLPVLREMAELARSVAGGLGVGHTVGVGGTGGGERIVGDFRIAREVGRGGMGIVYEAEQLSLGRRVALKVLPLAAAMDPRALQRFQLEAQATAWLQHPQIVPVYAVGSLGEVPYYAMQYIEGASLAELIAELRRFEVEDPHAPPVTSRPNGLSSLARGLLSGRFEPAQHEGEGNRNEGTAASEPAARDAQAGANPPPKAATPNAESPVRGREYARMVAHLGVQAAEALDFAHGQGILHRDVKPANLLIDRRGVLWVTDFGLARLPGDGGVTVTGDVLGTLRYMSPEQALARRTLIDRRTDIYSLGATLYELLTLHPLVSGTDRQEILRKMIEEEPVPVRRLNPAVPVDLATIITKAICKDPARRYESAQHFADDLRRFLESRPIAARRTGPLRRAWRWCRRRPLPAGLAAGLVLALICGFVGVTLSWREAVHKRDLLEMAQQQSLAALARESLANKALTTANVHERAARELAQRRFGLAREAVEQYYTGASRDVLLNQPEMRDLRKRLLGTALSFYQRLQATSEQGPDDPKTQIELAAIYRRVGQIAVEIGSRQDGLEALGRARAILERLVSAQPTSASLRRDLAACIEFIGRLEVYTSGRESDGLRSLERSLALYETLLAEHPDNADDLFALANTVGEIGFERARSGDVREGLESLGRERKILQGLVHDHADNTLYRNQLALTHGQIGRIQANAGQLDEALRSHRESAIHLERLAALEPPTGLVRRRLGQVETDTARILTDAGRPADALPHIRRGLAILEQLAAESPAVASYQRAVAECYDVLGAAQARTGRRAEALQSLGGARTTLEQLSADHPDFIAYQADLAENHLWTGAVYQDLGRSADALGELSKARELLERLPLGTDSAYALARTESRMAVLTDPAERGRQYERAMTALRRAIAKGYRAFDVLQTDPCLNPLRARPDFQALLLDLQVPPNPFRP